MSRNYYLFRLSAIGTNLETKMKKTILFILLAAFICTAAVAEPVLLRYRFTEGDEMYYGMQADTSGSLTTTIGSPGKSETKQEVPLDMTTAMTWRFDVKEVDKDGVATIVSTIEKYNLSKDGNAVVDYDASKKNDVDSAALPGMADMLVPLTMKMDPRGIISDVKGLEKTVGMSPDFDIKNLLSRMQMPLPEQPVDVGDKWTQKTNLGAGELEGAGAAQLVTHFEFIGYEEIKGIRCAKLHVKFQGDLSSIAGKMLGSATPGSVPDIDYMNIIFTGDIYFAPEAGVTVAVEFIMDQDISATMNIPLKGKSKSKPMHMLMNMSLKGFYSLQ